jgi:diguanylate cyclase (GGDEF)-like protein
VGLGATVSAQSASADPEKFMARFRSSIHGQLSLFIATFLLIIVSMAIGATISLKVADQKTDELAHKWFAGAVILGELADRISEFRLDETYRAIALYPKTRAEAALLADEHRKTIEELQDDYVTLLADEGATTSMVPVRVAWKAYEAAHDTWIKADIDGVPVDEPARYDSSLEHLYKAADAAVEELLQANTAVANAEHAQVHSVMSGVLVAAIVVSLIAIGFAAWLLRRVRSTITRPLEAITRALTELAAGNRAVRVPELHRSDEIGEMANAFEMFRSNVLALDQAHEATRLAQEEAHTLARHDALTGLPNRRVFSAELQSALGHAQNGANYSVMLIDLDRFKEVNDIQGHGAGDVVLCEVARRLEEVLRSSGTVARLGGDEFAIIAAGEAEVTAHMDGAKRLANKLLAAIRAPIMVGESSAQIGASIGIAICGADGSDAAGLLRAADIAMYRAKRDGRGTFRFFEQSMDEDIRAQAALEADLKIAIADEQIEPFYQPLVDIRDNRICAFEALARWDHPQRGFVPPDVFVPLVEQLGLMADLTSSLLRQGCRDARHWPDDIRLSVNISPSDLKDPLFPTRLLAILGQEGFSSRRLDIEITETALVTDIETARTTLTTLQSFGVKISLDDFGTGYSSLYHLRELKFDKVKIDRSFVQAMLENPESEKIVDAILGLTKNLNLATVAEGIEDPAVLKRLAAGGCAYGQGYFFGKAMNATSATALLDQSAAARAGKKSVAKLVRAKNAGLVYAE